MNHSERKQRAMSKVLKGDDALRKLEKAQRNGESPSDFEWWKDANAWIPGRDWEDLRYYALDGGIRRRTDT